MTIKAKVTEQGLLIPREVAERVLGKDSEVEIREESGRLVVAAGVTEDWEVTETPQVVDPILGLGKHPVRTGALDGSTNHDRYLYADE